MVICTAQMYMQQYYDRHSLKTSDRIVRSHGTSSRPAPVASKITAVSVAAERVFFVQFISMAALFVACKVHETPRSLDVLVNKSWQYICSSLPISASEIEVEKLRIRDEVRGAIFCWCKAGAQGQSWLQWLFFVQRILSHRGSAHRCF
jgi:hypothetical protein